MGALHMMSIELIGLPFDGMGRPGAQRRAPATLRAAGLRSALEGRDVVAGPDPELPPSRQERAPVSGLLNETALLAMIEALDARLRAALSAGRFPLVYGADCAVLFSTIPALRDAVGGAGLLCVDGHEDATPVELSDSGEAANMEVALLLGWTDSPLPETIRRRAGTLQPDAMALLGPRDAVFREPLGVPSIAGRVTLLTPDELRPNPAQWAHEAVARIAKHTDGWWLHVDLDVLAEGEFAARGAPGEPSMPGGLTWAELTDLVTAALRAGGCRGWSLVIYNPDLDPDGRAARRIVQLVRDVAPHLP
jgi:arginase